MAVRRSAAVSEDGLYRYELRREWDDGLPPAVFVGLNPSTADGIADDPTVRRCVRFARDWGYGSLAMLNLWAWRATDPRAVPAGSLAVGPGNDGAILLTASGTRARGGIVVCCWGAPGSLATTRARRDAVLRLLGSPVHALGMTKDGEPRHPLYLPLTARPSEWAP